MTRRAEFLHLAVPGAFSRAYRPFTLPSAMLDWQSEVRVQLRKVEHPNGKSFHWACNGPDCPYESEEIRYTMDNYHASPPPFCPRCGRGGNQEAADSLPASIVFDKPA